MEDINKQTIAGLGKWFSTIDIAKMKMIYAVTMSVVCYWPEWPGGYHLSWVLLLIAFMLHPAIGIGQQILKDAVKICNLPPFH